jgi:hypothetical protein
LHSQRRQDEFRGKRREELTIINPHTFEPVTAEPEPAPKKKRDLEPGPGQALIARNPVSEFWDEEGQLRKSLDDIAAQERWQKEATVLRIGTPLVLSDGSQIGAWFAEGDEVLVNPSLLDEVDLGGKLRIALIPFSAVKGRFVEASGE